MKIDKKVEPKKEESKRIKLRLDKRTTITLKTEEQAKKWMEMYPKAVRID